MGNRASYSYNTLGQITSIRNPLGLISSTIYDSMGRMLANVNGLAARWTYAYDAYSNVKRMTDPLGTSRPRSGTSWAGSQCA